MKYPKWLIYAWSVHKAELLKFTKNEFVLRPKHGAPLPLRAMPIWKQHISKMGFPYAMQLHYKSDLWYNNKCVILVVFADVMPPLLVQSTKYIHAIAVKRCVWNNYTLQLLVVGCFWWAHFSWSDQSTIHTCRGRGNHDRPPYTKKSVLFI